MANKAKKLKEPKIPVTLAAIHWLANGNRGLSSETIFTRITGINAMGDSWKPKHHPLDPSDLSRCRKLLEQCPEFMPHFRRRMKRVSKEWDALLGDWDDLCALMDRELPHWRTPKHGDKMTQTYNRMKELGL